jgi:hypothetical protein
MEKHRMAIAVELFKDRLQWRCALENHGKNWAGGK